MSDPRILIIGWPKAGKTTFSARLAADHGGIPVRHTDDLIGQLDWSAASAAVAKWLEEPGPWVIEGVAGARALRKWREAHPGEAPPITRIINLTHPHVTLDGRQAGMGKGCDTVLAELASWISDSGIRIETRESLAADQEERELFFAMETNATGEPE